MRKEKQATLTGSGRTSRMKTQTMPLAPTSGALAPPLEHVLRVAVPDHLWRVRLESGETGWWKRDVTPPWRLAWALGSHARAQREYAALLLLRARGVSAPEPLGWSVRRLGPLLLESALLTRETADVQRLDDFLRDERSPARRAAALEAAGALAAQMHARGIGHFRLLPKNLHVERARPERAWILDAPYACAWSGSVPRRVRLYDLCTLAGPASDLSLLDAETLIEAYERHGGTVTQGRQLLCASPCELKVQRITFYLTSVWSRHRPERFLNLAGASR